jgi:hypothetical protein
VLVVRKVVVANVLENVAVRVKFKVGVDGEERILNVLLLQDLYHRPIGP